MQTQLSRAISEYTYLIGDKTQQQWREQGYLTAAERQAALEDYREKYHEAVQDYHDLRRNGV